MFHLVIKARQACHDPNVGAKGSFSHSEAVCTVNPRLTKSLCSNLRFIRSVMVPSAVHSELTMPALNEVLLKAKTDSSPQDFDVTNVYCMSLFCWVLEQNSLCTKASFFANALELLMLCRCIGEGCGAISRYDDIARSFIYFLY